MTGNLSPRGTNPIPTRTVLLVLAAALTSALAITCAALLALNPNTKPQPGAPLTIDQTTWAWLACVESAHANDLGGDALTACDQRWSPPPGVTAQCTWETTGEATCTLLRDQP